MKIHAGAAKRRKSRSSLVETIEWLNVIGYNILRWNSFNISRFLAFEDDVLVINNNLGDLEYEPLDPLHFGK